MKEEILEKYAEVLIWGLQTAREKKLKKYDIIRIYAGIRSSRLVEIINRKLIKMKFNTYIVFDDTDTIDKDRYVFGDNKQISFIPPWTKQCFELIAGNIYIGCPESLTYLSDVDPKLIGNRAKARRPFSDILNDRELSGDFGWTYGIYATPALAQAADTTISVYEKRMEIFCFLNADNPVNVWKDLYSEAQEIKYWLNSLINQIKYVHIESEKCNFKINLGEARKWIGISGHNIPSFEIFLSPDFTGTNGTYYSDQPSYRDGNLVKDVHLEFRSGSVNKLASYADVGDKYFRQTISTDKGASKVGEFSLTDIRLSRINCFMAETLYDENYGGKYGNCHIALGDSYLDTSDEIYIPKGMTVMDIKKNYNFNHSSIHWDLVNSEKKTVTAHLKDGSTKIIYDSGKFCI